MKCDNECIVSTFLSLQEFMSSNHIGKIGSLRKLHWNNEIKERLLTLEGDKNALLQLWEETRMDITQNCRIKESNYFEELEKLLPVTGPPPSS